MRVPSGRHRSQHELTRKNEPRLLARLQRARLDPEFPARIEPSAQEMAASLHPRIRALAAASGSGRLGASAGR